MNRYRIYDYESCAILSENAFGQSCDDAEALFAEETGISVTGLIAVEVGFDGSFEFLGPFRVEPES